MENCPISVLIGWKDEQHQLQIILTIFAVYTSALTIDEQIIKICPGFNRGVRESRNVCSMVLERS